MTPVEKAKDACSRRFWRFVHNAIAHPLMEVLPERWGTWLHDTTAEKAFIAQ